MSNTSIRSSFLKTTSSALAAKAVFALTRLLTIPLLLVTLGQENYAALLILCAFEGWFLLLDFGVGNALQFSLTDCYAKKEDDASLLRTGLLLGSIGWLISLLTLSLTVKTLSSIFLHKHLSLATAAPLFFYGGVLYLVQALGSIANRVLFAKQKGYVVHVTQAVASLASLILVLSCKTTLFLAVTYIIGLQTLGAFGLSYYVFHKVSLRGKVRGDLLGKALRFFLFSVMAAFVTLADSFIVPLVLGTKEILSYNLLCKLFGLVAFAYSACLQALSSFTTTVIREHRWQFCFYAGTAVFLFTIGVKLFQKPISSFFSIEIDAVSVYLFGLYLLIRVACDFHATLLQSAHILRPFFYLVPVQALINFVLLYLLGTSCLLRGLLLAQSLSYLVTVFWVLPLLARRHLSQGVML
ncbi:MAG: hypothetical protein FJZ58_01430 [Chlamydiae bacterium]|nr:hypothetical protein [Chlamydiota bacterium]